MDDDRLIDDRPLGDPRWSAPRATYRLQWRAKTMTFRDGIGLIGYLKSLGVTHVYSSPFLKAAPGSEHGYDVADHSSINPELGSIEDFEAFCHELKDNNLGHLVDVVPNHMSVATDANHWWNDVLENGASSKRADWFDIDWRPSKTELRDRILLPVLGRPYGDCLEAGELKLALADGSIVLRYFDRVFPTDPKTWLALLASSPANQSLSEVDERELAVVKQLLIETPERNDQARRAARQELVPRAKVAFARWLNRSDHHRAWVEALLAEWNGTPSDPAHADALDQFLDQQAYRLAFWRVAGDEINYRRFFDVISLAAVAMERHDVFDEAHRFLIKLLAQGDATGWRIDHVDGLFDPERYLERLARVSAEAMPANLADRTCYIVVEKILARHESLPAAWPIAGTTGYDFMNDVTRLLVSAEGYRRMERDYRRFTGASEKVADVYYEAKQLVLRTSLASDLNLLAHRLNRLSESHRRSRDFTAHSLRSALAELLASWPVYRTYIGAGAVDETDRAIVDRAVEEAKRRNPSMDGILFDYVGDVLLGRQPGGDDSHVQADRRAFVGRFQQISSPVMAKGVEDTALFRYFPLLSVNEVGGGPNIPSMTIDEFHAANQVRAQRAPVAMLATSTHDTKRSEDVRARLIALTEAPDAWRKAVVRWSRLNRAQGRDVDGARAPSRNDELWFYQTLVGTWPLHPLSDVEHAAYVTRLQQAMEKSTREAKVWTSWTRPNEVYDAACRQFVARVLDRSKKRRFLDDFQSWIEPWIRPGLILALSQVVFKMTCPGVPDLYQGQEWWDDSLLDPDNRRPVDFGRRSAALAQIQTLASDEEKQRSLVERLNQDLSLTETKLFVTWRLLALRKRLPQLFQGGDYVPLPVDGPRREDIVAFARQWSTENKRDAILVVAPRRGSGWPSGRPERQDQDARRASSASVMEHGHSDPLSETHVHALDPRPGRWKNLFSNEVLEANGNKFAVSSLFKMFPVAVFHQETESQ